MAKTSSKSTTSRKSSTPSKSKRGSGLSKATNNRRNSKTGRQQMSSSSFALPKGQGSDPSRPQYRMDTLAHARNARARVKQHGTPSEVKTVYRKTAAKYPSLKNT